MKKDIVAKNQNTKLALTKAKRLLDVTNKLLNKNELIKSFEFKPYFTDGHTSSVYSVAISSDNRYIVSGSWDNTVKIWDTKNDFKEVYIIYNIEDEFPSVAINPNGFFHTTKEEIDKFLRVSEKPLGSRRLTDEEIKYFYKKEMIEDFKPVKREFKKVESIEIEKDRSYELPTIDIDDEEIPF